MDKAEAMSHFGQSWSHVLHELLLLCRTRQRRGRRHSTGDGLRYFIEVACAYESLMPDSGISELLAEPELLLLYARVSGHALACVLVRQFEHAHVQSVEAGQSHELEFESHRAQLPLELRQRRFVQHALPVARRSTIVREH